MGSTHNKLYVSRFIAFKIRVYLEYLFNAHFSISNDIFDLFFLFLSGWRLPCLMQSSKVGFFCLRKVYKSFKEVQK